VSLELVIEAHIAGSGLLRVHIFKTSHMEVSTRAKALTGIGTTV
jgi:hypothetical protein